MGKFYFKALRLRDSAQEHLLLLPRDFTQACWLFRLLDKNLPSDDANAEGQNADDVNADADNALEPNTEAAEPSPSKESNANQNVIDNIDDNDDAMGAEENAVATNQVEKPEEIEDSMALELTDDCDIDEPQITPLDPEAVERVLNLLVDRTVSMTLSQIEDVGIALSAMAVKCYGQDVNQVLNVYFNSLIIDFVRLYQTNITLREVFLKRRDTYFWS